MASTLKRCADLTRGRQAYAILARHTCRHAAECVSAVGLGARRQVHTRLHTCRQVYAETVVLQQYVAPSIQHMHLYQHRVLTVCPAGAAVHLSAGAGCQLDPQPRCSAQGHQAGEPVDQLRCALHVICCCRRLAVAAAVASLKAAAELTPVLLCAGD